MHNYGRHENGRRIFKTRDKVGDTQIHGKPRSATNPRHTCETHSKCIRGERETRLQDERQRHMVSVRQRHGRHMEDPSACLSFCPPACLSVCLPVCLSACLSVCLSACLSVCLPACLSALAQTVDLDCTQTAMFKLSRRTAPLSHAATVMEDGLGQDKIKQEKRLQYVLCLNFRLQPCVCQYLQLHGGCA